MFNSIALSSAIITLHLLSMHRCLWHCQWCFGPSCEAQLFYRPDTSFFSKAQLWPEHVTARLLLSDDDRGCLMNIHIHPLSISAHPRITLISSTVLLVVLVSSGSSPEQGLHLSSDFETFSEDQEMLIMAETSFDYIEGFVIINRTGILNNWRASFKPQDPVQASHFQSDGRVLYCLELTKNFNSDEAHIMEQEVSVLLSRLRFIRSTLFHTDVTYLEFLDRVHTSELKLRAQGLWEVPHPWLNLLIPRSSIRRFAKEVFGKILKDSNNGPILLYPVNKSKWDNRTSVVIPDEEIFYLVGFLSSAPSLSGHGSIAHAMNLNNQIVEFCEEADIGMKQYLAPYTTQQQWKAHFGARWETFERRKHKYDPLAILAPGQRIFPKASLPLSL